jgi:hypothetical protein
MSDARTTPPDLPPSDGISALDARRTPEGGCGIERPPRGYRLSTLRALVATFIGGRASFVIGAAVSIMIADGAAGQQVRIDTVVVSRADADAFLAWSESRGVSAPARIVTAGDRVVVLDRRASRVRVLDTAGAELVAFGRDGQGPGEFRRLAGAHVEQDRYWIYDMGNARVSVWTRAGELVREFPLANPALLGAFAVFEGAPVVPTSGWDAHLISGAAVPDEAGFAEALARRRVQELPYSVDLVASSPQALAVFENATGRLVWIRPGVSPGIMEIELPQAVKNELDRTLEAHATAAGSRTVTQYVKDLQIGAHGDIVLTFVRPLTGRVVGAHVTANRTIRLIALASNPTVFDEGYMVGITSISTVGDCFILGSAWGLDRLCPVHDVLPR